MSGLVAFDENGEEYLIKFPSQTTVTTITKGTPGSVVDVPTPEEIEFENWGKKEKSNKLDSLLKKHHAK